MSIVGGILRTALGIVVAVVALIQVVLNSPLMTLQPDFQRVYLWTLGFLFGVFLFGWGIATLVSQ